MCKIILKTQKPTNSVRLNQTQTWLDSIKLGQLDRDYKLDKNYKIYWFSIPFLFAFCPLPGLPFFLCLLLKSHILNPSIASTSNANWDLGFCRGHRQGRWERGRERKRGAVRRWLFWFWGRKWKGRKREFCSINREKKILF